MINLDSITNGNNKKHNENLVIGGSRSGKTNTLLNLINEQNDIDKVYIYMQEI